LVSTIILILVLATLKAVGERLPFFQEWEHRTYKLLLHQITAAGTRVQPDIQVIDISTIEPEKWTQDGRTNTATPRGPLKEMIAVLTDLRPRSVGVDVDFAQEKADWVHFDDRSFFDWCLQRSAEKNVPILLGVYRSQTDAYNWLGDDRYMRLAATIAAPAIDHSLGVKWISVKGGRASLPSIGAALAGIDPYFETGAASNWTWAVRSTSMREIAKNLRSAESVIDFGPLQRISEDVLPALPPNALRLLEDKIRNRMVILGDVKSGDTFSVPGVSDSVPGVLIHACIANTLVNEPLYRLTFLGRIALDVFLALVVFALVKISRWGLWSPKHRAGVDETTATLVFTSAAVVVVTAVSIWLVRYTRLLWTDFLFVCAVLFLHATLGTIRNKWFHRTRIGGR
jgi:CHASE2 domain-containing sensor protein